MDKQKNNKPERRARGEGTVLQRADGRWVARVSLGDGKRKEEYCETKQEAERAKRRMLNERDKGNLATGRDQSFEDYLNYWLGAHSATVRVTTYATYRKCINNRIIPALGHVMLRKLTVEMIQTLYQKWGNELSPNTIRLLHSILNSSLEDAVTWKKIPYNPAKHVKLPKGRKANIHVLTDEEIESLLQSAMKSCWYLLFYMALLLGMREGELLGLKWSDIDFDEGALQIHRTMSYIKNPVTMVYGFVEGPPKTEAGLRLICLPPDIIDLLQAHQQKQLLLRQSARQWKDLDLVFCTAIGSPIAFSHVWRIFSKLLEDAGIEHMKFHALRHNASMILRRLGIDSVVRKEMLGHASILMTDNDYGHATLKMHKDAVQGMNHLFGEKKE